MNCRLFEGYREEEVRALLRGWGVRPVRYAKGELIFAEGDEANQLGVVLSGRVDVEKYNLYGNRGVFATLEAGELFAEAFAFSNARQMTVNVRAGVDTQVLKIPQERIMEEHRLVCNALRLTAQKMQLFDRRIEIISERKTRDRLLVYLKQMRMQFQSARFTIPLNRQGLADYLNVDRSGLSMEIHRLMAEGVLVADGSHFDIHI